MKIYWMFLILSFVVWWLNSFNYQSITINGQKEKTATSGQAIVFFSVIIFFCGLRSGIADTGTYIHMFENYYPDNLALIEWGAEIKDKGFYILTTIYKQFISNDWQGWLFLIALVSGWATMFALKRYSINFGFSCFLFVTTTMFTYLINGMRQYICVAIVFASLGLIIERRFFRFLILILLLSTIHASVLVFIPVYFIVHVKPWSMQMMMVIATTIIFSISFEKIFPFLGVLLEETQYKGYVSYITEQGVGSNALRLVIAAVPCILAFVGRKIVEAEGNTVVNISINMSIINLCIYFIATFSSGMAVGRMTIYFDIFNLLLLPWLIKHIFTPQSSRVMTYICVFFYVLFFYVQMVVTWNLGYESSFLRIFC